MTIKMLCEPALARQFFNIMGSIVYEFRLVITPRGWNVAAVDPANVVLINIDLPKDNFMNYEFGETDNWTSNIDRHPTGIMEEELKVGIDVDTIKQFLGGMYEEEILIEEELNSPVEFILSKSDKYNNRYELQLKQGMFSRTILLLPESEIRRSPKKLILYLDYKLQLKTLEVQRIVKKALKVSDYIRFGFEREEGSVIFTASTVDGNDLPWDATKQLHGWQALRDEARDSSSSLFSLDYLCDIVEKIPSETVWLHIGHDNPCILSFKIGRTGTIEYKIAPRVEAE